MQDYAVLFEKKYLLMNDAERLREMRRISRKKIRPAVMLCLLLAALHTRP
jgi:hypothetical protein